MRPALALAAACLFVSTVSARADGIYSFGRGGTLTIEGGQVVASTQSTDGPEYFKFIGQGEVGRTGYEYSFESSVALVGISAGFENIYDFEVPGADCLFTGDYGECDFPQTAADFGDGIELFGQQRYGPDYAYLGLSLIPPATVTPEPSTFALLGTGLLGVAGVLRKRLA